MFFSFLPSEALFPAAFFSSAEAFSPAVLSFPGRSLRPTLGPARCGTRYGVIAAHFQTNLRNSCKNRTPHPLRIAPPPPFFAAAGSPPAPPHPDSLRSPLLRQHPTRPARLPRLHPVYALRSTRIVRSQPAHIAHLFPIPGIQPPPRCRRNSSPPTPRQRRHIRLLLLPEPHPDSPPPPPSLLPSSPSPPPPAAAHRPGGRPMPPPSPFRLPPFSASPSFLPPPSAVTTVVSPSSRRRRLLTSPATAPPPHPLLSKKEEPTRPLFPTKSLSLQNMDGPPAKNARKRGLLPAPFRIFAHLYPRHARKTG